MTALAPLVVLAVLIAVAGLGMLLGVDTRPGVRDEPPGWLGRH